MCLDISFYSELEQIDSFLPGLRSEDDFDFDAIAGAHVMALGHKRYPVVLREGDRYVRRGFEWGIIAEYMNTPEKVNQYRRSMVNARSEKVLGDKNSFWHRIRQTRCLIPVTGIYEHRAINGWKNKVPYHIRLQQRPLFFLPGLYHYNVLRPSNPETGEMRGMFTLITRPANEVMRQIHNDGENAFRMPLFLPEALEQKWLSPNLSDAEMQYILNFEMPANELEHWPVYSIRGRKPRPDGQPPHTAFRYELLPALGSDDAIAPQISLF